MWLWFAAAGLLTTALVAQSITEQFVVALPDGSGDVDVTTRVWEWFLPHILPTLGVVGGVGAFAQAGVTDVPDPSKFRYAALLSGFYLSLLALSVLRIPITDGDPLPSLERANLWLGPAQGLAAGGLSLFFATSRPERER